MLTLSCANPLFFYALVPLSAPSRTHSLQVHCWSKHRSCRVYQHYMP